MSVKDTVSDVGTFVVLVLVLPVLITYGTYSWFEGTDDRTKDRNLRLNHDSDTRIMVACLKNSRPQDCNYLAPIPLPQ